ncbi:maestro heat-like repeat-containing protein family member 1 [Lagopus muta]|uniref:maestro heat-like repeat-containing protein family member 1 n=1 Tax=Lagopus muta TaxID=64668 RepID=UPI00209EBC4C|nr:maestro heat-like repeat-containing protein family member 1 [Lagopus muta]
MLGQLGERLFLQTLSPKVCSNLGAREEAEGKGTLASPVLQQFLRASLDTINDEAWIEALSCKLSRWLSSSPSSSGEKAFLYKALGTALGACKGVLHVQEKQEPSEAQAVQRPECEE